MYLNCFNAKIDDFNEEGTRLAQITLIHCVFVLKS